MLIYIKTQEMKRPLRIPMPYHLGINLIVRKSFAKLAIKGMSEELKENESADNKKSEAIRMSEIWINQLNFAELRESLHDLKQYKGMALVDVHSADGQIVKVII